MTAPAIDAATGRRERSWSKYWSNPVAQWALALGLGVHLAGFFLFSIERPEGVPERIPAPEIVYAGPNDQRAAVLAEQSYLMDYEPLFLPTARNASILPGAAELVERTEPFSPLPPRLLIGEGQFPSMTATPRTPIREPVEALARQTGSGFSAFGQRVSQQEPLPARPGLVEIFPEGAGRPVVRRELDPGVIDEALANLSGVIEWRIIVSEGGLVTAPLLRRGSGLEYVDALTADYLVEHAATWGLAPGYYRVVIGP